MPSSRRQRANSCLTKLSRQSVSAKSGSLDSSIPTARVIRHGSSSTRRYTFSHYFLFFFLCVSLKFLIEGTFFNLNILSFVFTFFHKLIELFQAQRLCQGYIQVYLGQRLLPRSGTFKKKKTFEKRQTSQMCYCCL